MKRSIAFAMGAMLLVLSMASAALAAVDPFAPHPSSCISCHPNPTDVLSGTTGLINICVSCHNAAATVKAFNPKDLANPFGSTALGVYTSGRKQTSHNWAAPAKVPAAGAADSQILNMQVAVQLQSTVNCGTCHNPHDNTNGKFLRIPNDSDQICFDCHRSRNQRNHLTGTHPVNFTYTSATSKVKLKPTDYQPLPVNANPVNPTAAMKLTGGKVLCTTCHGVHFTDSNARTFDNHSSSTFGQLSSSQGNLLRTDMRGGTANATNICTNCHTNKLAHNYKGQNIQCADCHAGHVDPGDGTAPNVWLVRRYMNYSGGVQLSTYRKKVFYQYTGSRRNFAGAFGVCQSCHAVPQGDAYPPEHASTDANVCLGCHVHNSTSGSFAGGCTTCHGFPPQQNVAGGPDGYARTSAYDYSKSPAYKDESLSPHMTHAGKVTYSYGCAECHAGNKHATGNFQQVFNVKSGIASTGGATPTYNTTGNGTCLNTYCHSNGAPRGGVLVSKAVSWAGGKNTITASSAECVSCHAGVAGGFNNLSTNAHFRHVSNNAATGRGYSCDTCHAATVNGNTKIATPANHVNGAKDISFSGPATGSSWGAPTCATYCHSNGGNLAPRIFASPDWTNRSSGACGTCHSTTPYISNSPFINTNGHFAHFSSNSNSYGPMLSPRSVTSCQTCHTSFTTETGATHVDGMIEVLARCTPCHNQAGTYDTFWSKGTVACESCHTGVLSQINGVTAPDKSQFATLGHGKYTGLSDQCLNCHVRNDRHITATPGAHVTRLGSSYQGINQNDLCSSCHNNPAIVATASKQNMSPHVLDKNSTPTPSLCSACHDVHGTTNLFFINTSITFKPNSTASITFTNTSSAFVNLATNRGLCQVCHTKTNHYKRGVTETGHPSKNCLACHDHKGSYAFKPNGNCDSCHGYPPVASMAGLGTQGNYSGARPEVFNGGGFINGGGAHSVAAHIKPTASRSEAWGNCAVCHSGGDLNPSTHRMLVPAQQANIVINVNPRYRLVSSEPIVYSGPLNGTGTGAQTTGSCSNVSCHFKPSPLWAP